MTIFINTLNIVTVFFCFYSKNVPQALQNLELDLFFLPQISHLNLVLTLIDFLILTQLDDSPFNLIIIFPSMFVS